VAGVEDERHAREVGPPGGQRGEHDLLATRRPGLLGAALVQAQLLAQEQQLHGPVVAAAREDLDQVEEERARDVEDQEGHRHAPAVVWGTGRASVAQGRVTDRFPRREAEM
jgi:hypothetical protein